MILLYLSKNISHDSVIFFHNLRGFDSFFIFQDLINFVDATLKSKSCGGISPLPFGDGCIL